MGTQAINPLELPLLNTVILLSSGVSLKLKLYIYTFLTNLLKLLFTISIVIFYLNNFHLSSNKYIKIFQLYIFVFSLIFIIYTLHTEFNTNIIQGVKEDNKDINLHGHVAIDKETGNAIATGINTIGANVGLAGTIAAVTGGMAKVISNTSLPPLQKGGLIIAGAVAGGAIHTGVSYLNKGLSAIYVNSSTSPVTTEVNKLTNNDISKFLADGDVSPLQGLLLSMQIIDFACLAIIYILVIQLIFKFASNTSIQFNINNNIFKYINFYLNKIIILNKKVSLF
jgi:hypothetical protein